jgi:hypothetical protein
MTPVETRKILKRGTSRQWIRWLCSFSGIAGVLMGSVIAFVVTVDPYQIYHPVLGGKPRFDIRIQRFQVPGMARTGDYQIALVGTSMLQNIPNSAVQRMCGMKAINLCISGASIHEEALTLALALKHKGTKTVIATLDYNSLSGGSVNQVIGVHEPFPEYLYDNGIFDKLSYLLSWDSILTSYHALHGKTGPWETENADWPWKFPATMKFEASNAVRDIDPSNINKNFRMTNLKLGEMEKAFGDSIFPVIEKDRDVRIHFVFAPYSILVWHDYAQRGQIQTYFEFRKWLVAEGERLGNFDVVDFQDRGDIITNMALYADIYHSNESIDEEMVGGVCRGDQRLNSQNIADRNQRLLDLVKSTNPADIVRKAREN